MYYKIKGSFEYTSNINRMRHFQTKYLEENIYLECKESSKKSRQKLYLKVDADRGRRQSLIE